MVGKAIIIEKKYDGSLLNQNAVLIRSKDKKVFKQQLLLNHFRTKRYLHFIETIFRGNANQASITLIDLFKFQIPLPKSEKEQQAIAEVLSDVDALITSLDQLINKKRNIKQGTMQLLLTGKKRLVAESKEGYKQTEIGIIPKDWEVMTYGNIFNFLSTATYSRSDLSKDKDVLYVHYGDIHTKFENFLDPNKIQLPSIELSKAKKYSLIENGDLLMADASEDYEGICKSVEVKNLDDKKAISGLHTFLLRDNNEIFVDGFRGFISSNKIVKSQFDKLATGLKVYGVSKTNLKLVSIPVPPKNEQKAIAQILSDMDAEIEALENKRDKYKAIKQGMMQELLTGKTRLLNYEL